MVSILTRFHPLDRLRGGSEAYAMRAAAAVLAVALGAASAQEQNFSVIAPQSNSRIATSECFPLPPQRTIDCSALAHLPWLLLAAQTFGWRSSCRPAAL